MPRLTRWLIRTAFLYLILASFLSLMVALPQLVATIPFLLRMNPAITHLLVVGWVTQMIFGVIYWMFPIITRENPRGRESVGWAAYVLLNVGLLLRLVFEPQIGLWSGPSLGWILVVSAVCQWVAAALWVYLAWPRVKDRYRGG